MSHRKRGKKASQEAASSSLDAIPSKEELQRRWQTLKLNKETQKRLERLLLQEGGALVALAATDALALERGHEERALPSSMVAWLDEQLRALFLEEGSSHIVESARIAMETLLAWNIEQGMGHLPLPLLDVGIAAACLLLFWLAHRWYRSHQDVRAKVWPPRRTGDELSQQRLV